MGQKIVDLKLRLVNGHPLHIVRFLQGGSFDGDRGRIKIRMAKAPAEFPRMEPAIQWAADSLPGKEAGGEREPVLRIEQCDVFLALL